MKPLHEICIHKALGCILAFFLFLSSPLFSQTFSEFKEQFRQAETAAAFDAVFRQMMDVNRKGKLEFMDTDVREMVDLTREKEFANAVLPKVYGWAAMMFGNGRVDDAIVYFLESAALYEKQGKSLLQSLCYFEVALIQHKAENFEEAREFYEKTLALAGDSLDYRTAINCFNGFALIQRENGQYTSAENAFRDGHRLAVLHRDTAWIAILAGNIGSIHKRIGNFDSSLYYYQQNLSLIKRVNEVENEIETYANIGRLYVDLKKPRVSLIYLDSAEGIIRDRRIKFNDFFDPMDAIYEGYALAYEAMGDQTQALHYQKRFHEAAQSKQQRLNGRSLKQLQLTESFNQKQKQLNMLHKINEANVKIITQQRYVQGAFLFTLLLVSAFAIIVSRTSKQRKRLNRELSESNAELERLNALKNKLFSVISHDLRSPLNNLQGLLDLFRTGDLNKEDFSALSERLGHHVKTSGDVLENLLQWARYELREIKANPACIHPRDVMNKVFLQFDENLKEKGISCHNNIHLITEAWADENQVEIVFRNLIGNAIKYTPSGGDISVSSEKFKDMVRIYVRDNGMGMSPETMSRLFKPGDNFTTLGTKNEKGTGLGLIISYEMIRKNGGNMEVQSKVNDGSVFIITLPLPPAH
ncbi:MAG TPA: tetratricopeptide repeat-containing sensor histidine kinase [Ohtaekwangia sp.]